MMSKILLSRVKSCETKIKFRYILHYKWQMSLVVYGPSKLNAQAINIANMMYPKNIEFWPFLQSMIQIRYKWRRKAERRAMWSV